MRVTIYGIKNCDTMKKARGWLETRGVEYEFHDYKASGIDAARLTRWCREVGWEKLLNRAGTTFRKLPDADKEVRDERKAIALGARAVGLGRFTGLALAAAGPQGLVRALEILEDEIKICLGLLGVTSLAELNASYVTPAPAVGMPDIFSAFPHAAE